MVGQRRLHGEGGFGLVHGGWMGNHQPEEEGVCLPRRAAERRGPEQGRGLSREQLVVECG